MFIHTHIICGSDRSIQPDIGEPGALPGRINVHQAYDPTGLGPWGNDRSCGTSLDQSLHSVHQSAGAPGTFDQSGLFSQKYSVLYTVSSEFNVVCSALHIVCSELHIVCE